MIVRVIKSPVEISIRITFDPDDDPEKIEATFWAVGRLLRGLELIAGDEGSRAAELRSMVEAEE